MSRFRVEWEPAAENELARVWLRSSDPSAVTAASARADQLLSNDPIHHGRYLSEDLYAVDVPPLVLTFTVDLGQRLVVVTWVRSLP